MISNESPKNDKPQVKDKNNSSEMIYDALNEVKLASHETSLQMISSSVKPDRAASKCNTGNDRNEENEETIGIFYNDLVATKPSTVPKK